MPKLRLALLSLVLVLASPASRAQSLPAAEAPQPAAPAKPVLSQAEARQLTDLLNDPQKRAIFAAQLQTLAKAQEAAAPAPKAAVKLAPDSVGAQLLKESSSWLTGLSGQLVTFGRLLGDLPTVWSFTLRTLEDPVLRARALDAAWRMVLILAVAGAAEWGLWLLLRRPTTAMAAYAPAGEERGEAVIPAPEPGAPEPAVIATVEARVRHRRFTRTLRALKRLPFVLMAFLLDLLPLGLFIGVGYAGTILVAPQLQDVLQAAILAYATCRLAIAITRMFVSPEAPALRLLHVSDQGAAYCVIWVRRIFAVGAFGFASSSIGHIFGLPQQANDAFLKTVFLLVHLFLVVIVLQCRAPVARQIRGHGEPSRAATRVRSRIASIWHFVAIFYIVGLWLVWAAEVRHGYLRIWHIFLVACAILIIARLAAIVGAGRARPAVPDLARPFRTLSRAGGAGEPLLPAAAGPPSPRCCSCSPTLALLQSWGIDTLAWFGARALGGKLVSAIPDHPGRGRRGGGHLGGGQHPPWTGIWRA